MRTVKEEDMDSAYKLTCDIVDSARSLADQGKWDPFHIEIIWEQAKYDIHIDVSIKPKEK